jgi:hypothetical protein
MNQISQIESLLSILLASFEMQINTLHVLGGHRMRPEIIHRTKQLIQALVKLIETIEHEFISEIEKDSEQALSQSATLMKAIDEARREVPEMEILGTVCGMVKSGHTNLTASLAQAEQKVSKEVSDRFTLMKNRAETILSTLEKM